MTVTTSSAVIALMRATVVSLTRHTASAVAASGLAKPQPPPSTTAWNVTVRPTEVESQVGVITSAGPHTWNKLRQPGSDTTAKLTRTSVTTVWGRARALGIIVAPSGRGGASSRELVKPRSSSPAAAGFRSVHVARSPPPPFGPQGQHPATTRRSPLWPTLRASVLLHAGTILGWGARAPDR